MGYNVKVWIRGEVVACTSQMCDKDCPNFGKCVDGELTVKEDEDESRSK